MDDVGWYESSDTYTHQASVIKFDKPDLDRFPRFKDVEWQRVDLFPGDGTYIYIYIYMHSG